MKHRTTSAITIALLLCLPASAAQKKTAHTVDLLDPDPATVMSGDVAVRVRISVDPYKDGKEDGLWTWWDENGLKEDERRH